MPRTIDQLCREISGAYVTSWFGDRAGKYAGFHRGIDLGGYGCGGYFKSPVAGRVITAATAGMGKNGHTVEIHFNPMNKDGFPTHALVTGHHLKLLVKRGDWVEKGDTIATVGGSCHYTGNLFQYSCHVHLEVHELDGNSLWRRPREQLKDPARFYINQEPIMPSDRFKVGDTLHSYLTEHNVIIREAPGIHSKFTGNFVAPGGLVEVMEHEDNGVRIGVYNWWFIGNGWVAEEFFDLHLPPPPEVEEPLDPDDDDYPFDEGEEPDCDEPEPEPEPKESFQERMLRLMSKVFKLFGRRLNR